MTNRQEILKLISDIERTEDLLDKHLVAMKLPTKYPVDSKIRLLRRAIEHADYLEREVQ